MIIAVCDDQITEGRALAGCLASILQDRKLSGNPICFSGSGEMLKAMGNGTFPINFLDIYMDGINGVEDVYKRQARIRPLTRSVPVWGM